MKKVIPYIVLAGVSVIVSIIANYEHYLMIVFLYIALCGAETIASLFLNRIDASNANKSSTPVKIKLLNGNSIIPTRGSKSAAGYDLYACIDEFVKVPPHKTVKIGTGIAVEIPEGTFGGIYARSGLATKKGLAPANCVGVIDSDYRGEVIVSIHNSTNYPAVIQPRDRIAQLIVQKYENIKPEIVTELEETERADGGFGSTGE